MKIVLSKNSRLHRANCEGGFAGITAATLATVGTVAGIASAAASVSLGIYSAVSRPDGAGGGGGSISPDTQYFLQQETLLAEYAAQKQAEDSTRAANYAYEQANQSKAFFTYAAAIGVGVLVFAVAKKSKIL